MVGTKARWAVWWMIAGLFLGGTTASGQDRAPIAVEHAAAPADAVPHEGADADHAIHGGGNAKPHGPKLGTLLALWTVLPFVALLLCIAVFPLVNPHWWEHNRNKAIVAAVLGIPTAAYLFSVGEPGSHALEHAAKEYVSFLLLLGSLFVISGGIYIRGAFQGGPLVNAGFLTIGTMLASVVGTTGASMLLIRPLLRANARRTRVAHIVVFFIFTVSNCGGLLTPLGDPPLFIGFLKGVPFNWTLRLWPQWLMVNGLLLVVFFLWDSLAVRWERRHHEEETPLPSEPEKFGIQGGLNFVFLAGIVATVIASGQNWGGLGQPGKPWPWGASEIAMAGITFASYFSTRKVVHEKNRFGFGPILEVAILFSGIFTTMIPALALLNVRGHELGLNETWEFFWVAGVLSSFLDNAPTYLAFAVAACGAAGVEDDGRYLAVFLQLGPKAAAILAAVSCGAVFMGANTYIGNGPNFMVKAIAEENNVRMPSFFGYMAYSIGILIPIFIAVTFVFFR